MSVRVTNLDFLQAVFGENHPWAHVTGFPDDPSDIQGDQRFRCWAGDYYSRTLLNPQHNTYFTVSLFYGDDKGKARRRKALYRATYVVVLDDVREKLPLDTVLMLPEPSYKLQTSPGSEQWGYILDTPCTDRHRIDNLHDGLIANGLAPNSKDPGQKGVTRYVRLPEGVNSKRSKLVNGLPVPCQMLEWHPERRVTLEELAEPFGVNLDAERREGRVDGAANVPDHPLLQVEDLVEIKSVRSDGRFDVTCPWVADHTGGKDDGAAIFTNNDGSIGFKCHHGSCQHRTGGDLLKLIETTHPGFKERLDTWKVMRVFGQQEKPAMSFMDPAPVIDFMQPAAPVMPLPHADAKIGYQQMIDALKRLEPGSQEQTDAACEILKVLDSLDHASRLIWWNQIRDLLNWSKSDLSAILDHRRKEWYAKGDESFYEDYIYITEQNSFYSAQKRMMITPETFQNAHGHLDGEARHEALMQGRTEKVDRLDYAPGMPEIFTEGGVRFANAWRGHIEKGSPGCVQRWLDHFDVLRWGDHKKHILQWMAFTLRHPERKINHMLILGGGEGNGKDFLLYPLQRAMGRDATTIDGDELLRDFNDYLLSTKYLHINESELGDRKESRAVANKMKPLAAAPPGVLRVNIKGVRPVLVRNVVNCTMTSNSATPVNLSGDSRRYYAVWTDVSIRGADGQMTDEWRTYWNDRWEWIRDCEGWKACVHHLMTEVDLSDFNPGAVPQVTDFVKEIQEASEDPLCSVLKEYIRQRLGLMACDLVTTTDIAQSLKTAPMVGYELRHFPPLPIIGKVMKQNGLGYNARAWGNNQDARFWILRNHNRYLAMTPGELYEEYQRQMAQVRAGTPLSVVQGRMV